MKEVGHAVTSRLAGTVLLNLLDTRPSIQMEFHEYLFFICTFIKLPQAVSVVESTA